jgi:hypothetical protein
MNEVQSTRTYNVTSTLSKYSPMDNELSEKLLSSVFRH